MPTYEFRCPDGTIIERIFKFSDVPDEIPAPDGSGMAVRIISGGAGLIFKGSGFYITDYGKDGKKDQRPAPAGDAAASSGTGGSPGGEAKESGAPAKKEGGSTPALAATPATPATPKPPKPGAGE